MYKWKNNMLLLLKRYEKFTYSKHIRLYKIFWKKYDIVFDQFSDVKDKLIFIILLNIYINYFFQEKNASIKSNKTIKRNKK